MTIQELSKNSHTRLLAKKKSTMSADTMKFEQKPSTPEIFRKAASFTSQLHVSIPFGEQEKE